MTGFGTQWSNDAHLWWIEAKPGEKLELALPVANAGEHKLAIVITGANENAVKAYMFGLDYVKLVEAK